jgi:hypothetical protein
MGMKVNRKVGDRFRPVVTVLKMRKGVPSVIEVSGNRYILSNNNNEKENRNERS